MPRPIAQIDGDDDSEQVVLFKPLAEEEADRDGIGGPEQCGEHREPDEA